MFIGHFAVGFGAKKLAPAVSLGTLFAACQLADLLWPIFVIAGVERVEIDPGNTAFTPLDFVSYPYSHSALSLLAWSLLFGGGYLLLRKSTLRAAAVLAAVVFSHFVLDVLTHRPDMPLTLANDTRIGLGLWDSVPGTVIVEGALFALCVWRYASTTYAADKQGRYALWGLVAFLLLIYVANIFSPPPPSATAVAWTAVSMWLLVAWGYWIDAHRTLHNPHES